MLVSVSSDIGSPIWARRCPPRPMRCALRSHPRCHAGCNPCGGGPPAVPHRPPPSVAACASGVPFNSPPPCLRRGTRLRVSASRGVRFRFCGSIVRRSRRLSCAFWRLSRSPSAGLRTSACPSPAGRCGARALWALRPFRLGRLPQLLPNSCSVRALRAGVRCAATSCRAAHGDMTKEERPCGRSSLPCRKRASERERDQSVSNKE